MLRNQERGLFNQQPGMQSSSNPNPPNNLANQQSITYTYELPYQIRKDLCDLLDVDDSWRRLGGEFMGLDSVQLGLIDQAIFRKASRTGELLTKLELSNLKVYDLYMILEQMNHLRAMEILRPVITPIHQGAYIREQNKQNVPLQNTPIVQFDIQGRPEFEQARSREPHHAARKCHRDSNRPPEDDVDTRPVAAVEIDGAVGQKHMKAAKSNLDKKRVSLSDQDIVNQLRIIMQISYEELRLATSDFNDTNILGNGGFASVYRGIWKGTDVAIKRLRCGLMDQALNELTILNSYRIDNIVPIYGISFDGPEACLVYQFMVNGSLDDRLSCKGNSRPLNWNQRATIGEGIAKGLFYLHTLKSKPLVHGDVKSANVLLDAQFTPKLGDFGLSRQVFNKQDTPDCTHCTVSSIHGTSVYLPPEYLRHKMLSSVVDVYSYGIVLLEMATGRRAYDGKRLLIDMVENEMRSMPQNQISYKLKDPKLENNTQTDLKIWYELLIKLGLACANKNKRKRPDMACILKYFTDFRAKETRSAELAMMNIKQSVSQTSDLAGSVLGDNLKVSRQFSGNKAHNELTTIEAKSQTREHLQIIPEVVSPMEVDAHIKDQQLIDNIRKEHQDHSAMSQGEICQQQDCPPVEPIIPLLTELGVVREPMDD